MRAQVVLIALLCSACGFVAPPKRAFKDVKTRLGVARGYLYKDPPRYAFLGLPYARAPTKSYRFRAPDSPPKWDGIFESTHRVRCPQPDGSGEENCLVLNVFMPQHAVGCCMPVLVFVHDGGFQHGWGAYQPPARFIQDFIVVTLNYRLGALGFLCLGTAEAPGNAGLKDQFAALYWVKSNIASFGGNPEEINIYGVGSGAASIQLLLLSGLMEDLVHRVILESGSALSPTSMAYNPFDTALTYAVSLGYEDEGNMEDLQKFYKDQPVTNLLNTSLMFLPCVEHDTSHHSLIERDPIVLLKENNYDKVPMLIVYTNANEIAVLEENPEKFQDVPEVFDSLLPNNLGFDKIQMKAKIANLIKEFYFKEVFLENILQDYADYVNDIFMEYPVMKFATLYAARNSFPVYLMKFTYNLDEESKFEAKYGEILNYVYSPVLEGEKEVVAEKLMSLFINFLRINDPTPLTTSLIPLIWPPVTSRQLVNRTDVGRATYLIFCKTYKISKPELNEAMTFLDQIYDRFFKVHDFDGGL